MTPSIVSEPGDTTHAAADSPLPLQRACRWRLTSGAVEGGGPSRDIDHLFGENT
jgi:hypothetical protein